MVIASRYDLREWVWSMVGERVGLWDSEQVEEVTDQLVKADHPDWGCDWSEWLGSVRVTELVEGR